MSDFNSHLRIGTLRIRDLRDAQRYAAHEILRNDTIYDQQEAEDVITSIFEGIPLGHLATSSKDGNTFKYIIGGQRVRAILKFMADELKITGPRTQRLRKYSEMCVEDRERFEQQEITLHSYTGLTDEQEHRLYVTSNMTKPLSHGEFVRGAINVAPMCRLACDLSDRYHDDLKNISHVFSPKSDVRQTSNSWTLIVLSNFHHGEVLYGRKLPCKKNEELCRSFRGKPIDAEMLTERFEELMQIVRMKKTNMKYPSYVLASVQAIMLDGEPYTAGQVTDFLSDMLDRNKQSDLHKRWNTLVDTPGLDANLPGSCISRVKIFQEWIGTTTLAPPPSMGTPRVNFREGDFVWVNTEGLSDKCELARIIECLPNGSFEIEWWYRGWKSKPCASIPDEAWSLVTEKDLVLDNDRIDIIDGDCIEEHADRFVHEKAEKKLMWTRPAPGRRQYKVIDFIPKKYRVWTPDPEQRVYARDKLRQKFSTWSSEDVEDLVDEMARESKDSRDFASRLNTWLNWEEA